METTLIMFDQENQNEEIQKLKAWNLEGSLELKGYTIKNSDRPIDVSLFDQFIILIGASTKYLSIQFYKDLEAIIQSYKPILCLNLNGFVALETQICPAVLQDAGAIHMAFTKEDLLLSLRYMKSDTRKRNPNGCYHFRKDERSCLD